VREAIRLDLDQPFSVDESLHFDKRTCGPYIRKDFAVRASCVLPPRNIRQHHSRADDMHRTETGICDGLYDDFETSASLTIHIARARYRAIVSDGSRAGDRDIGAHAHGSRETRRGAPKGTWKR